MPKSLKEAVLDAVDIVDVIGERVALTRKGKELVGLCPFHNDHRPSFNVNATKQIFKCWACGAGGDVIRFVQLSHRVDFREALRVLAERAGIDVQRTDRAAGPTQPREELHKVQEWARTYFQRNLAAPEGTTARDYSTRRGLTPDTIDRWRIGLALGDWDSLLRAATRAGVPAELLVAAGLVATSEHGKVYDRFRNRLMFPICDAQGRCVAFGGRTLADDPAKYLNSADSPLFSKSRILFGLDLARNAISRQREALVVEGYLDAIMLHQAGIDNAVATLGTALTDSHVRALKPLADKLTLCFDNDQAGQQAAERGLEAALRHRIVVQVAVTADGKDPADSVLVGGAAGFTANLHSAADALEFKWRSVLRTFGAAGPLSERSAAEECLRFIAKVSASGGIDPLAQGMLISRLSELTGVPGATLYGLLGQARATTRTSPRSTPDTSEQSAYAVSVGGLPPGLISAVEELFGLALFEPSLFVSLRDDLASASGLCGSWRRLHDAMSAAAEAGDWTREQVVGASDDADVCELIGLACDRAARGEHDAAALADELLRRVRHELDLRRAAALSRGLRDAESDAQIQEQRFRSLLDVGRRVGGVLPADRRMFPVAGGSGAG